MKRFLPLLLSVAGVAFGAGKDYVPGFMLVNAVTMAADVTSGTVDARGWDNVDFEIVATGTPTGTFFVDCTLNPPVPPGAVAQTWVALGITTTVAGAASNIVMEINQTGCQYLRLRYVRTGGTGALTVYASEKQI